MGIEQNVRQIVRQAGYAISNNELKILIKEYNNYEYPISMRLIHIVADPRDFLKFLKTKDL